MKIIKTEKALRLIELNNTLMFEFPKNYDKKMIKEEIEKLLDVKVEKVNVAIKDNKKYAYVKLKKENPAIDVATKLGVF